MWIGLFIIFILALRSIVALVRRWERQVCGVMKVEKRTEFSLCFLLEELWDIWALSSGKYWIYFWACVWWQGDDFCTGLYNGPFKLYLLFSLPAHVTWRHWDIATCLQPKLCPWQGTAREQEMDLAGDSKSPFAICGKSVLPAVHNTDWSCVFYLCSVRAAWCCPALSDSLERDKDADGKARAGKDGTPGPLALVMCGFVCFLKKNPIHWHLS